MNQRELGWLRDHYPTAYVEWVGENENDPGRFIPAFWEGGSMWRVVVHLDNDDHPTEVIGVEDAKGLARYLRSVGLRYAMEPGRRVLVAIYNPTRSEWLSADGTPTKDQDGVQFRALELGILCGSVRV